MKYLKSGNNIYNVDGEVVDTLDSQNYQLKWSDKKGFFLAKINDFELPKKLYGDFKIKDRIITKFKDNTKSLGVLFDGEKGSGKTLLSQLICKELNLPVISVMESFTHDPSDFIEYLNNLPNCVILLDEFDKTFSDNSEQEQLLNVLESNGNKKLFILTSNNSKLNTYLVNRPSRIFYRIDYKGLSEIDIEEIIEDLLIKKEYKIELLDVLDNIPIVNIDLLISIIKEINLFDISPLDAVKVMNIIFSEKRKFYVKLEDSELDYDFIGIFKFKKNSDIMLHNSSVVFKKYFNSDYLHIEEDDIYLTSTLKGYTFNYLNFNFKIE